MLLRNCLIAVPGRSSSPFVWSALLRLETEHLFTPITSTYARFFRTISVNPDASSFRNVPPNLGDFQIQRSIHNSSRVFGLFGQPQEEGLFKRVAKKMGWTETSKSTLRAMGYLLYIKTADGIDDKGFFKYCQMEDTFVSWFMCVELHVWMLSARLMQEGDEGKIVRNALIKAMWEDCDTKSKKLEGAVSSARKKQIQVLNEEFQASLLSYDEGLLGNDKVLASALWRRFLRKSESNPKLSQEDLYNQLIALEMLVIYVRAQYYDLNQLSREKLLKRKFNWLTFDSKLYELADKFSSKRQAVA